MGDEEPKKEPEKKEEPKEETTPKQLSDVEKVTKDHEELKDANDKIEAELLRGEQLRAKVKVGGETDAGQVKKVKTEDEKWAEGAKERYEGTGLDPTPDDTPTTFG